MIKLLLILFCITISYSNEPISPIPLENTINIKKAKLGQELFFDPILSKDNSTSCFSCHNVIMVEQIQKLFQLVLQIEKVIFSHLLFSMQNTTLDSFGMDGREIF